MQLKYISIFISLVLLFITSACNPSDATPTAKVVPSTIVISWESEPEYRKIDIEVIEQNNCGGNAEVENQIQKSRSIAHTIEVGSGFQVNANGQVGFAGTDIELGATIANELGYSYGIAETIARSITVKAKAKTYVEHHIKLQEAWKIGTAKVVVGDKEARIPFYFRTDFALDLVESKELKDECDNGIAAVSTPESTTGVATPIPLPPTNTPIPSSPTTSTISPQQAQCQWLQNNFPQSPEEVKVRFGFSDDTTINFVYELCPSIANAFAFKAKTVIELQVPSDGCIDSWAGFTEYVGNVGTPIPDGAGGWRVYKGGVRAPEMTYRVAGCTP